MFSINLRIALRNLLKNKVSSFINIAGLTIGMAIAVIIGLWINDELSFNKSFPNYGRIGQVMVKHLDNGSPDINKSLPIPLGVTLRNEYKSDFESVVMFTRTEEYIILSGDKKFTEGGRYMQPEAPDLFSLHMLTGSRAGLADPHSILLSESLARTIFGQADPMNQVLKIDNKQDVKVTGVYRDLPHNTELSDVRFIVPWDLLMISNEWYKTRQVDWMDNFLGVYVLLAPHVTFENVSQKIKDVKKNHETPAQAVDEPEVFIHPMSSWHLYSTFENGVQVASQPLQYVWLYGIIGVFVLLLACINFMNLSTARSQQRAKEVGIRKAIGSLRMQLVAQFYSESLLAVLLAFVLSLFVAALLLPWFNEVAGKQMELPFQRPQFWLAGISFAVLTGLIAGSYPALYLSGFNPISVLKGTFHVGRFALLPRKILVVVQFTVSVTLIISTIIVYQQIRFSKDRPIGYDRNGLIYINMKTDDIHKHYEPFRNDLLNTGAAINMAESNGTINELWSNNGGFSWKGKDPTIADKIYFGTIGVSAEFGKTVGWQFIAGRDFSRDRRTDSAAFVINEAAAKYMGLTAPVGEDMVWNGQHHQVIGVIKDVLMESPYQPVTPTVFFLGTWNHATVSIRLNPNRGASESIATIEEVFKKFAPAMPFDYRFADKEFADKFADEDRVGKLAGFFAALTICISCLGLFGLSSFVAEQRTREIGIRKVIGASVFNVWKLLSKEFVLLVLVSCVLAIPIAYFFLHEWLQKYAYRTELSWWIFAVAGAGALLITILTVSFQSVKAAVANPVKSLRSE